jgi:hypothetical protein
MKDLTGRFLQQGIVHDDDQIRTIDIATLFNRFTAESGERNYWGSPAFRAEDRKVLDLETGKEAAPAENSAGEFRALSASPMKSDFDRCHIASNPETIQAAS